MSAQSVTEPIPQFHDRDGQPLDGGFIFVGQAGLDAQANQIQLYLDSALTVPLAQPVQTLNGYPSNGGTPVAFYAAVGDFSIKLLDAQGLLVLSAPNVTTRLDAANLTGSISAALISFLQFGTGAVARTVQDKLRDTVSVFDFMTPAQIAGVKAGTFLVDVTAPINAAISSGAREVFFPQGGYAISAPINIGATSVGVSLVGAGRQATVIRNTGATPAVQSVGNPILKNASIRIADMSIEGQPGTQSGVLIDYSAIVVLERLDCYANGADGIRITNSVRVAVNDCWSRSNTANGITIGDGSFYVDIKGGIFEVNNNNLVVTSGVGTAPRHITVTGASFTSGVNWNAAVLDNSFDVRFFGCDFVVTGGATTRHVSIDGGGGTVAGVVLDGCTIFGVNGGLTTAGVYANACRNVSVSNSVIDCTGATAYDITASALRTRFVNNAVIVGTTTDASTSTVQVFPTGTTTAIARSSSYTGATIFDYGNGYGQINVGGSVNAFRFKLLPFADGETFEINSWKFWVDSAFGTLRIKGTDPANAADGFRVGPGTDSFTFANLPAGAPVGYMARCTNLSVAPVFGAVAAGGGVFSGFVIWNGGAWTVCGV